MHYLPLRICYALYINAMLSFFLFSFDKITGLGPMQNAKDALYMTIQQIPHPYEEQRLGSRISKADISIDSHPQLF